MFEKRYVAYYAQLIQDFVREAEKLSPEQLAAQNAPCLPVFGKGYENTPMRIVIVAKNMFPRTNLAAFVAAEQAAPGTLPKQALANFRTLAFLKEQPVPSDNMRFVLELAARMNGLHHKWDVLPCAPLRELLDQIAWAEWTPADTQPVPVPDGSFCHFRHLLEALQPNLTIVPALTSGSERYAFDGCQPEVITCIYQMTHYLVKPHRSHVMVLSPPGEINPYDIDAMINSEIPKLLAERKIPVLFPEFARAANEGDAIMADLTKRLPPSTPLFGKYAAIGWVAKELERMDAILSFSALLKLLSDEDYTNSRNIKLMPKARGGAGKLVRSAANRLRSSGKAALADSVTNRILTANFDTV